MIISVLHLSIKVTFDYIKGFYSLLLPVSSPVCTSVLQHLVSIFTSIPQSHPLLFFPFTVTHHKWESPEYFYLKSCVVCFSFSYVKCILPGITLKLIKLKRQFVYVAQVSGGEVREWNVGDLATQETVQCSFTRMNSRLSNEVFIIS